MSFDDPWSAAHFRSARATAQQGGMGMFRRRKNRIGAAVALAAVLALGLAAPARAAGWGGWGEARDWAGGLLSHFLPWLSLKPDPVYASKCDYGPAIDPNGCPKAVPKGMGVRRLGSRTVEDSQSRGQF